MTAERKVTVTVQAPHGEPLRVQDVRDLLSSLPPGMGAPAVIALMGEKGSQRDPEPYLRGLTVVYDPSAVTPSHTGILPGHVPGCRCTGNSHARGCGDGLQPAQKRESDRFS